MPRIYATPTLRHLERQQRLLVKDLVQNEAADRVADFLRSLLSCPEGIEPEACPQGWLSPLTHQFLVVMSEVPIPRPTHHFAAVTGINFELTYGCNLACSHCLQDGLRPVGKMDWINAELVSQALEDASWLGLMKTGVNFTGGEVYFPGSPILDLISQAAQRALRVRCNTNAWWGGRARFTVGKTSFSSDADLVRTLRDIGLTTLAMSLDNRYEQYPELLDRVLSVAALCEQAGLSYEFVSIDAPQELTQSALVQLTRRTGRDLEHRSDRSRSRPRSPDLPDTVDIGAAAGLGEVTLESAHLAALTATSPCQRKGFYRPYYLHVNPDGGVRSCLFAPGSGFLGHLTRERLPEILNQADTNPVVRLFADGFMDDFVANNITKWRHLYRNVEHPCAVSALVARVCERLAREAEKVGRELTADEKDSIHRTIAREWNLTAAIAK